MMKTIKVLIVLAAFLVLGGIMAWASENSYTWTRPVPTTIHGGMWNKSDAGFVTVDLAVVGGYVQIMKLEPGILSGFTVASSNLTALYPGTYQVIASTSLAAPGNSEFGIKLFQNTQNLTKCYAHQHIASGSAANLGFNCLVQLSAGDNIGLYVDDHNSPVNDPVIESANINVVKLSY